jgi:colicin import membrane protein
MNPSLETKTPLSGVDDPFRYGWRYVHVTRPDGTRGTEQVPLSLEDTLHPEEGDFIVDNMAHHEDASYLYYVFQAHFASRPDVITVSDCRVDWQRGGVRPHGPDLAVIAGIPADLDRASGTIHIRDLGAQPLLVIEITSPDRPDNDLVIKVDHYYRAGVPFYAVVDGRIDGNERHITLLGYKPGSRAYEPVATDERGWLWLETVKLWLAPEEGQVRCYDATGNRFEPYARTFTEHQQAEKRAEAEKMRADAEKARAEALEQKNRELEAELRRLHGDG